MYNVMSVQHQPPWHTVSPLADRYRKPYVRYNNPPCSRLSTGHGVDTADCTLRLLRVRPNGTVQTGV